VSEMLSEKYVEKGIGEKEKYYTVYSGMRLDKFYKVRERINYEEKQRELLIIGEGENREKLENYIKKLNLEEKVIFTGYRENIEELMALMDIFVLTSLREGLPHKKFHKVDMKTTWADIKKAQKLLNWQPQVNLEEGIKRTVEWTENNWEWVQKIKI
jgi:GDP-D-mannose dehydratase